MDIYYAVHTEYLHKIEGKDEATLDILNKNLIKFEYLNGQILLTYKFGVGFDPNVFLSDHDQKLHLTVIMSRGSRRESKLEFWLRWPRLRLDFDATAQEAKIRFNILDKQMFVPVDAPELTRNASKSSRTSKMSPKPRFEEEEDDDDDA